MAKKGELKSVCQVNIGLDRELARAVSNGSEKNERNLAQEVRFALRQHYGLELEDKVGAPV